MKATNGHSRSMDFHSLADKRELVRPIALNPSLTRASTSSSTTTLTSLRVSSSLEFDDSAKPSGVLVDDDFLPMSSPVDEHFWDMPRTKARQSSDSKCFPNVGSSPDLEVKRFDVDQLQTLSGTDDDDDDDGSTSSTNQSDTFARHEYKIKELQKPLQVIKSTSPLQTMLARTSHPSRNSTEPLYTNSHLTSIRTYGNLAPVPTVLLPLSSCQLITNGQTLAVNTLRFPL